MKPDFATHFFDNLFDDEESKAGAGDFAGLFVGSKEAGENFGLVFFVDAHTLVFDVSDDVVAFDDVVDSDGAGIGILDGI